MKNLIKNTRLFLALAVMIITASCNSNTQKAPKTDSAKTDSLAKLTPTAAIDSGHLVGAWHDEAIKSEKGEQIAYEVISSGKKIYIQAITFTGTNLKLNDTPPITASASEITRDGDKFVTVGRPTETYRVDKKGNLLIYDDKTLIAVCKRLL